MGTLNFELVPELLLQLDSDYADERAEGIKELAQQVAAAEGEAAALLAEFLRDAGALEVIVPLISDESREVYQAALFVIGNLCGSGFDAKASTTKKIVNQEGVVGHILPRLQSGHQLTQLYSVAAMQNLCNEPEVADTATKAGAANSLERLLSSPIEDISRFAAGALSNLSNALQAACDAFTTQIAMPQTSSPADSCLLRRRQVEKEPASGSSLLRGRLGGGAPAGFKISAKAQQVPGSA